MSAAAVLNNPIRVPLTVSGNRQAVPLGVSADRQEVRFGAGVKIVAGNAPPYTGEYEVTPKVYAQSLNTHGKRMEADVTVLKIPYAEASNLSGGYTVTIGG